MVKIRPVVVLRKHSHNQQLVTIVPLSTTEPERLARHHVVLPSYLPGSALACWAKWRHGLHRLHNQIGQVSHQVAPRGWSRVCGIDDAA
ncbi:type II toxin-antitoxin system PemK/MazF family toxin [Pseudomonas sp.]|nr:type II toxin-antitoxin system PemK/MazF family toxin [Pseudomonas sp.]